MTQSSTTISQAGSQAEVPGVVPSADAVIQVRNLRKWYTLGRRRNLKAVDDVSFDVERGRTLGLVGESGCGKTTILRLVLQLQAPTSGQIFFEGEDITLMSAAARKRFRRSVQAVFQDPWASLNPRMRVGDIVAEPMEVAGFSRREVRSRVEDVLAEVGLGAHQARLFPHEFSGGQRQRIAIARALTLNPMVIVLDEPVSALDVSIRAQILNLLVDLQKERDLAYLMVSHDLATVRYMCDRVAVMYLGVIQEIGSVRAVFGRPLHLYTEALMSAALPSHPDIKREEIILPGELVSPINPPPGDVFMTRTPLQVEPDHRWTRERPPLVRKAQDHWVVETPWSLAKAV